MRDRIRIAADRRRQLFGLADLQVAPTTATVALDRRTATVTPSCNAGLVSYSTNGSLPTFVTITQLDALVNQILSTLGSSGSALSSAGCRRTPRCPT